ncbi:MAG: sigma-70 family RNA polymerase sigma factor [Candidatus Accumulibacter sp.]|uniref:sigma-70 family RNA polymerase sigma factor n=1 Tax=Accumulibacter sp. TaxID=2053492 RepID=UPI002878BDD6|nr:sigma-70 family RNA polymerase sigma factor [Accumulibacter sp.]MDS4013348.1 sigma-70 family RNA polymerase sigma factor [Accumulibacter sp.]
MPADPTAADARKPAASRRLPEEAAAIVDELDGFRRDMLRFALLQLRDRASAEDAVQEAMLAALESADRFAQRARLKTWAFSILRNKIVDAIRRRTREASCAAGENEMNDDDFNPLYTADGHWQREMRPATWGNPEQAFENRSFWAVLDACLDDLPPATARVFMMREMLGLETGEICRELSMTANHCWVVLHRARMSLRLCLDQKWFAGAGEQR